MFQTSERIIYYSKYKGIVYFMLSSLNNRTQRVHWYQNCHTSKTSETRIKVVDGDKLHCEKPIN